MKNIVMQIPMLIILLLATALAKPAYGQGGDNQYFYAEDLEDGQAQGWDLNPGWAITLYEDHHVLTGQGHTWAYSQVGFDDYRLKFRLKIPQGTVHLVYRLNSTGRYFISFGPDGSSLHKQTWPDQFQHGLAEGNRPHDPHTWYEIEISGQGDSLQFMVNGNTEWIYSDPDPFLNGSFAFESLEDASVIIDDIRVELAPTSAFLPALGATLAKDLAWVRTGGPLGGLGYDIRMRPDQLDHLLVTDANAGVFLSKDGGNRWIPSNEGITTRSGPTGDIIPIFCLTIDPVHPNTIWAGTQDARGIFRSTDGGLTWEKRDSGIVEDQGITFRGFTVDPTDSDIVYASAEISSFVWNNGREKRGREFDMTGGIVYKTTDGGLNWTAIWKGNNLTRYVWINPRDPQIIYLSTGIFDREAKNSNPVTGDPGGEGVLKSTDGGRTWAHSNNGLNNLYVGSLFMDPSDPDILLAGAGNNQYAEAAGVYRTDNGGESWTHVLAGEIIESVEISTGDPSIAYAAGATSVYRSQDGGLTWDRVSGGWQQSWGPPGIRAGFPIDLQIDPRDPDRLFANAYGGGNFLSTDGGRTWSDASLGYTGAQVRALAVDPDRPARILAAARSGLFISNDGGAHWEGLAYPPVNRMEWNSIVVDPADPAHLLAGTNHNSTLAESRVSGSDWDQVFDLAGHHAGWKTIIMAPSDSSVVYAGTAGFYSAGVFDTSLPGKGIYRSMNGGSSWSPANDMLSADAFVHALAVSPINSDVVFAATANHGLIRTEDGGLSWQVVEAGLPADGASAVAIHPTDPAIMMAGFERNGLFVSSDGGLTWERSSRGLMPEASISMIVFDPIDPQNTAYLSDLTNGVYRTTDGRKTWTLINNGLFNRSINALALSGDGQHLYAASEGGGVFRLDLNGEPPIPVTAGQASTPVPSHPPDSDVSKPNNLPAGKSQPSRGLPCAGTVIPLILLGLSWRFHRRSL